jgi:hypothetical protein
MCFLLIKSEQLERYNILINMACQGPLFCWRSKSARSTNFDLVLLCKYSQRIANAGS